MSKFIFILLFLSGGVKAITLDIAMQYAQTTFDNYEGQVQKCSENRSIELTLTLDEKYSLSSISYSPSIIQYLEERAFNLCALENKLLYTESLILLENLNIKQSDNKVIEFLQQHKSNNFNVMDLEFKIDYFKLPSDTRQKLESIKTLQKPFNGLALKNIVWPNH